MNENTTNLLERLFEGLENVLSELGYQLEFVHMAGDDYLCNVTDGKQGMVWQAVLMTDVIEQMSITPAGELSEYCITYPDDGVVIHMIEQPSGYDAVFAYLPTESEFPVVLCYRGKEIAFRTIQDALNLYRWHFGQLVGTDDRECLRAEISEKIGAALRGELHNEE